MIWSLQGISTRPFYSTWLLNRSVLSHRCELDAIVRLTRDVMLLRNSLQRPSTPGNSDILYPLACSNTWGLLPLVIWPLRTLPPYFLMTPRSDFVWCQVTILGRMPFFGHIRETDAAIEFVTDALRPLQAGQPSPCPVRLLMVACHSWSGPFGHFHHTFLELREVTPAGVKSPFFVGCHCSAISGYRLAKEFVTEALQSSAERASRATSVD